MIRVFGFGFLAQALYINSSQRGQPFPPRIPLGTSGQTPVKVYAEPASGRQRGVGHVAAAGSWVATVKEKAHSMETYSKLDKPVVMFGCHLVLLPLA